ncbi:P-loop containing nucleoside triphosphate hydrolase protein [Chytridium lagenaria]|nr:P-loop containing nucleoside triphosphate hydrolase protein [Chytridium lagenaria]
MRNRKTPKSQHIAADPDLGSLPYESRPPQWKAPGKDASIFERANFFFFGSLGRDRPWTGGIMPEAYVGFFSRSTYQWMEKFVITGNRRALVEEDLFVLEGDLVADTMFQRLKVAWEKEPVYEKCLRLSPKGRQSFSSGTIVNIMATDVSRMERGTAFLNLIWSIPFLFIFAMALLIYNVGVAAVAGLALLLLLAPGRIICLMSACLIDVLLVLAAIRARASHTTDKRVKVTQEALTGVQKTNLSMLEFCLFSAEIIPAFAAIATFGVYTMNGVLSSLALFNVLRIPCMLIPLMTTELTDAKVALDRLNAIMMADELDSPPTMHPFWQTHSHQQLEQKKKEEATLIIEDETAVETDKLEVVNAPVSHEFKLHNINVSIPRGSLVAVVGVVGSGKSSLLNGLVGEMKRTSGTVEFSGSVGYCPQTAWIQNATLKENILFGAPLNEARYAYAVKSCALERDLTVLPAGDDTEIGERGINLSGGQRQRVSLARAVYFDADVILLDDPLSAVDAHVGGTCLKIGKTRLLVTHQLHFLPQVDYVYMMDKGVIIEQGTYTEMMAQNGRFCKLVSDYGNPEAEEEGSDNVKSAIAQPDDIINPIAGSDRDGSDASATTKDSPDAFLVAADEKKELADVSVVVVDEKADKAKDSLEGKLMTKEHRATGSLSTTVIYGYMKAAGGAPSATLIVILLILAQLARIGTDLWLTWGFIQIVTAITSGMTFAFCGIMAARRLHDRSLAKVFRAPTEYFGRILNRFSKDIDNLDSLVPESARLVTFTLSLILGTVALICAIFPYFIAVLIPTGVAYYFVQSFFRQTTRELKRLDGIMRSPLFAHFASGLSGLATIRAYGVQKKFSDKNLALLDWMNRAYFPLLLAQRWLGLRLEDSLRRCVAVAARFTVGAGLAGLTISYSLQITGVLNWCVREFTELEQHMVSAERILEFDELKEEAPEIIESSRPALSWPQKGEIKFEGVKLRYREGLPWFSRPGEKIAIVGRTGAGKSTIILALLRLVEPCGGSVLIDGVDIGKIGLYDLRKRLAVIPQDPVLFSGTLRSNLDPFSEHTDQELWDVLTRSDLKAVVSANPKQLEMPVTEGGENWSTGQRQLICLARAMLRNAPIVILDEATASVDLATDDFIQKAIRRDFKGKTVLTIAHRLNTVIDYDRVLVLDSGLVAEFDSPGALLSNTESKFYAMVSDTGEANADMLKTIANREKQD